MVQSTVRPLPSSSSAPTQQSLMPNIAGKLSGLPDMVGNTQFNDRVSINLLPAEILVDIFTFVRGDGNISVPLLLGQIDRHWRTVANSAPELWSNVKITPAGNIASLSTLLGRCSSYPLDLAVFGIPHLPIESSERWTSHCATLISNHASHCRSISLLGQWSTLKEVEPLVKSLVFASAPLLTRFTSSFEVLDLSGGPNLHLLFGAGAPLFTTFQLSLHGFQLSYPPIENITELHLTNHDRPGPCITFEQFCSFTQQCPKLVILVVYHNPFLRFPDPYFPVCRLPSLRSLQLYGKMPYASELLLSIHAPCLQELVIAPVTVQDLELLSYKSDELRRSFFPTIHTLTLAPVHFHGHLAEDALPKAMVCFPEVEHLVLVNTFATAFLNAFTNVGSDDPIPWANLRTISLRRITHQVEEAVVQIIQFRRAYGGSVPTINVDTGSIPHLKLDPPFQYGIQNPWLALRRKMMHPYTLEGSGHFSDDLYRDSDIDIEDER